MGISWRDLKKNVNNFAHGTTDWQKSLQQQLPNASQETRNTVDNFFDPQIAKHTATKVFSGEGLGSARGIQAAAQGVYKGAIQPVANLAVRTALTGENDRKYKQKALDFIDKPGSIGQKNFTDTQKNIVTGFEIGGAAAPYGTVENLAMKGAERIAPKIATSPIAGYAARRATDVLSGQLLANPDEIGGIKGRLKQAAGDVAFGAVSEGAGHVIAKPVVKYGDNVAKHENINNYASKLNAKYDTILPSDVQVGRTKKGSFTGENVKVNTMGVPNTKPRNIEEIELSEPMIEKAIREGLDPASPTLIDPMKNTNFSGRKVKVVRDADTKKLLSVQPENPAFGEYLDKSNRLIPVQPPTENPYLSRKAQALEPDRELSFEGAQFRQQPKIEDHFNSPENIAQPTGKVRERGVVTTIKNSERTAPELAGQVEGSYDRITIDGTMTNAHQFVAENADKAEQIIKGSGEYNATKVGLGQALIEKYQQEGHFEKALDIIDHLKSDATSTGQANALWAYWGKLSPEGVIRYASREIDKGTKGGKQLTPEIAGVLRQKAEDMQNLTGKAKADAQVDLLGTIAKEIPTSAGKKLITLIKAGYLTGLKTTARNLIGNTVNTAAELTSKGVGSVIDSGISSITGKDRTLSVTGKGIASGGKEGLGIAKDVFTKGYDPNHVPSSIEHGEINWGDSGLGKAAKVYTNTVFRALEAQDKPFYYANLRNSLAEQAKVATLNSGKKGDKGFIANLAKNPTEEMMKLAIQDAERATFKNKTAVGDAISKGKQALSNHGELASFAGDFIMPFTQVPSSVASQAVAYTPVGAAATIYRNIKKGTFDQRDFSMGMGRALTGTALAGIGAKLAKDNLVTFGYPTDPKEQEQWKLENKQAFSVKMGGKWQPIGSLGPQAQAIIVGAVAASKGQAEALATMGQLQAEQPFLQGISNLNDAITQPGSKAKNYVKSSVAGLIPTLVKDVAEAKDPNKRETNSIAEAVQARIPGVREGLLPQRDAYGQEIKNTRGFFGTMLNPFNSSTDSTDTTTKELRRLMDSSNAATPTKLGSEVKAFGQKIKLDPTSLDKLEQSTGGEIKRRFDATVSTDGYKSLDDEQKAKVLNDIISEVRKSGKQSVIAGQVQGVSTDTTTTIPPKSAVPTKDQIDMAKYEVESGSIDRKDLGDRVVRMNPNTGAVEVVSKKKLAASVEKKKTSIAIETAKRENHYAVWEDLQKKEMKRLYEEQASLDPELDADEVITLEEKRKDLGREIYKYRQYGNSFTKPKKARKGKASRGGTSSVTRI